MSAGNFNVRYGLSGTDIVQFNYKKGGVMMLREYKVKFTNNMPVNADPVTDRTTYESLIKLSQQGVIGSLAGW